MGLREWVRARRITTPPPALPLVLLGFLASVVQILVTVVGCLALRRVVAEWVRRQPPDPPRAGPMNG